MSVSGKNQPIVLELPGTFALFRKLAFLTAPIFFVFASLGLWIIQNEQMINARDALSARIGNSVARTASSTEQLLASEAFEPVEHRTAVQQFLLMLMGDQAVSCAILKGKPGSGIEDIVAPIGLGCNSRPVDGWLRVQIHSDVFTLLEVGYREDELVKARASQRRYSLIALLGSLMISLLSSWVAFRVIVGRSLNTLITNLVNARDEADTANRAKTRFLANISHEIRTPMNGIIGTAELLSESKLTPQQEASVQTIVSSSNSLMHIIEDILDFAKIEAEKLEMNEDEFQLNDVIYDASDLIEPVASAKGLDLVVDIPDNLTHGYFGDDIRLRQVILNLLGNAVKFCEEGTVRLSASVVPQESGESSLLTVVVKDTGIGIPSEKLETIFSPFSQANDTTTRDFGGTGLGLTISRELVQRMGGKLTATSVLGEGSEFTFTIPLRHGRPTQQSPAITRLKALAKKKTLRVLVVDDVEVNLEILARRLALWDIEVSAHTVPEEALEDLKQAADAGRPYEAMILDFDMPGINGEELAELIREEPGIQDTSMILLSSVAVITRLSRNQNSPFDATMTKPLRPKRLARALMHVLVDTADGSVQDPDTHTDTESRKVYDGYLAGADVLVVDDSDINREVLRQQLAQTGCILRFAVNGALAVQEVQVKHPDIILMDISMPVMGGFEATREIRTFEHSNGNKPCLIFALSANVLQEHKDRAARAGMDGFIGKPTRRAELLSAIAALYASPYKADRAMTSVPDPEGPAPDPETPETPETDEIIVDGDINELRSMIGVEKLVVLMRKLQDQGDEILIGIASDLGQGAPANAAAKAHKLAGGAGTLGCRAMATAMSDLEQELLAERIPDADEMARLTQLWATTRKALDTFAQASAA